VALSARASRQALQRAGLAAADLAAVVVNTCTGYVCPGISTYLFEELGLARDVRAYDLVGAGCGGAMPNLEMCRDILRGAPDRIALSIAVEICSATFQMGDDLSLILSNALFADGAAAAVLWTRPRGPALVDAARAYAPEHREAIRYVHKGGQLHNQLSLGLAEEQVSLARGVLAEFGNMSSPTIWFEVERVLANGAAAGDWCVMIGAGAGLSAHAALLRL